MKTVTINEKEYNVLFGGLAMQALGVNQSQDLDLEDQSLKIAYYAVKYGQTVSGEKVPTYQDFLLDINEDINGYAELLTIIEEQQKSVNPPKPKTKKNGKVGAKPTKA